MLYEQYNYPEDYQDNLLVCIVAHPEKFMGRAGTLNSAYFTGVQRIATARAIFNYWREHGHFPNWDILSQIVYDAIARTAEEKDTETISDYVHKLRERDTSCADEMAETVTGWAKRRAQYLAIDEAAAKFQEGDIPPDGFVSMFVEANLVGTVKGNLSNAIRHISVADIAHDDGKNPEALIEGILPVFGLGILAGRAKSFKTWCAMELALAVAAGGEWLGYNVKSRPVVFVNFELMDKTLKGRFKAIAAAKAIDISTLDKALFALTFDGSKIQVSGRDGNHENKFTEAVCGEIRMALRSLKIKGALIILDSFYNLSGGANENDASQVKQIYRHIRRLLTDTESTGFLIHHFAKGDVSQKMDGERGAGSRVHRQEPDAYMELVPHREDGAVVFTADLRNYRAIEKLCFKWEAPLLLPAPSLDPKEIKKPGGAPELYTDHDMLSPLVEGPLSPIDWKKSVQDACDMSASTFKERKRRLIKERKVMKTGPKNDPEFGLGIAGRNELSAFEASAHPKPIAAEVNKQADN
jgi:hypothetical protein